MTNCSPTSPRWAGSISASLATISEAKSKPGEWFRQLRFDQQGHDVQRTFSTILSPVPLTAMSRTGLLFHDRSHGKEARSAYRSSRSSPGTSGRHLTRGSDAANSRKHRCRAVVSQPSGFDASSGVLLRLYFRTSGRLL